MDVCVSDGCADLSAVVSDFSAAVTESSFVDGLALTGLTSGVTYEVEPLQQPVRKAVGSRPTTRQRLRQVEEMTRFVRKFALGALKRAEPDVFPVRKTVGRSRQQRS